MGHVWVKTKIGNPEITKVLEVEALVDTGATLTVIPRKIAESLEIPIVGKNIVETAAGKIEIDRGRAWIEIMGKGEIVPVLISDVIEKVLIGITVLEILGLRVDPITGKLVEWTLLLY